MTGWNDVTGLQAPRVFADAVPFIGRRPLIACHHDADGLSAGVIVLKALQHAGLAPQVRIVGKGENPSSAAFGAEVERCRSVDEISGLILVDLGVSCRCCFLPPACPAGPVAP